MKHTIETAYEQGRVLVFGHRGARAYAPMNTLPSFEVAYQQGADGVELDVRLTSDGELVLLHDPSVDGTTNGHGEIDELTFAEVRALDAGAWFDDRFRGTQIPTLDEVFEAYGDKFLINVEIKAEGFEQTGIEAKTADVIRRHGLEKTTIISSFNPITLRRFHQVAPEIPIGYLHEPNTPFFYAGLLIGLNYEARNPYFQDITPRYMKWAKAHGYRVNTWTVNEPADAKRLRDLGVDCIITDKPDVIIDALKSS